MPRLHFILLSGGVGARVGAAQPKQFLQLHGKPVLLHSIEAIHQARPAARLVVVAPAEHLEATRRLAESLFDALVVGGATRHASTLAALEALPLATLPEADLVLIHDAARPILEAAELDELEAAVARSRDGIASLVAPLTETVVEAAVVSGPMLRPLDRTRLFAVKTPQAARAAALRTMLQRAPEGEYTDLLTWAAAAGLGAELAPAGQRNLKLTSLHDLAVLERLLSGSGVA